MDDKFHERIVKRRRLAPAAILLAGALALGACSPEVDARPTPVVTTTSAATTSVPSLEVPTGTTSPETRTDQEPEFKVTASQIISTFENSTTEIQYDYAENIGDGRGITAGRAGFTSGTHDLLEVVQRYAKIAPGNSLERYLPALEKVDGTDSTKGLEGFVDAWAKAVNSDEKLKKVQDDVVDELYYDPAMRYADEVGVETPLGKSIFFDTIIQHGEGDDPDGFPAIVQETVDAVGSADGNELEWLGKFLDIRQHHLENAADPDTRQAWLESVDRVEVWRKFVDEKNSGLTLPLEWEVYGDNFTLSK